MITADFLDQLNRFNLIIQKRVSSNYVGTRNSLATGFGLLFEDHKPYTPGDDFRHIDWKVYGRTDRLHLKRFEEERSLTVHIVTDTSASMKFENKWDYATMLTVGFAFLTMKENEKFQLSTFSDDVETFKPKKGRGHLAHMIDELNNLKVQGESNFLNAMKRLRPRIGSRSMVIIISDFLYDMDQINAGLSLLRKNEVKVIQLLDKTENDLDLKGEFKFKDSETRAAVRTFISPRLRTSYKSRLDEHCAKVEQACLNTVCEYHRVDTSKSIFDAFYEVLKSSAR